MARLGRAEALSGHRLRSESAIALAFGLLALAGAWFLLVLLEDRGLYGPIAIKDTVLYLEYGDRILDGALPYRDFSVEYPPAALPMFVLPFAFGAMSGDGDSYAAAFEVLMLLLALASVVFVWAALRKVATTPAHLWTALALVAVSPLLLGPVILSRYDLWPAALTAGAVALIVSRHHRLGALVVGIATMAKVYPILVLPLLVVYVWKRDGWRESLVCGLICLGTMALVLAPFLWVAHEAVFDTLARQLGRPLQIESLGAAFLLVVHSLTGMEVTVGMSSSHDLVGQLPDALALVLTLAQAVAAIGVLAWFMRQPSDARRFVLAVAATIVAYAAFGKVLSPQYMIWLVPLVPLVGGRRGMLAGFVLMVALLLTSSYFPSRYFELVDHLDAGVAWTVFLRDLALVAVVGLLVLPADRVMQAIRATTRWIPRAAAAVKPSHVLAAVVVGATLLRLIWLTEPGGSLIFDEAYYVNAARAILGWPIEPDAAYAGSPSGLDPNIEHPPLGKVAIATSMAVFGDNGLGWRLPSVAAGLAAIAALYAIVRATGAGMWLGIVAIFLFAFDNLVFVHSRIGTLDMMSLGAILVGAWLALARHPALAGVALAVGCLIKVTAIFGLLAVLAFELLPLLERRRQGDTVTLRDLRPVVLIGVAAVTVGTGGLWLLDVLVTQFSNPFEHVGHILGYGAGLKTGGQPQEIASDPWEWLINNGGFDYLRVDITTAVNGEVVSSHPSVRFQAALNPVLGGLIALVVPYGAFLAVRARDTLATWAIVWFAASYVPLCLLAILTDRIMYFYYLLPALPAIAALVAVFLHRARIPLLVVMTYLLLAAVAFVGYFPFRQAP